MINFNKSIIERYIWNNIEFLVKRDDLISLYINGNKAYKFYFLLDMKFDSIASFGGNQSNAMLALAYITKQKNANFTYFSKPLSKYLLNNIEGNLKIALGLGMKLEISNNLEQDTLLFAKNTNSIFIYQGGAFEMARYGIKKLADDIVALGLENYVYFALLEQELVAFICNIF
ncbi:hypothetical protein [Helicobacter sp. MIT 14-3879]|uniref:hypothetical protein n=1 Tax=Helicobacter sp. MIT 14-3879 TaxID=2040649 RepID=UPI000E1EA93B|nr:hypothetical protein [Helicobacter sp. MIT 14-3879]RDU62636.1 hypothetical protein CQA44_06525 [Helicobacter sp. MIT 14-3879]